MQGALSREGALEVLKDVLIEVGGGLFGPEAIADGRTPLADLGVDSIRFLTLILEFEERVGRKVFTIENLSRAKTVGDLFAIAAESGAQASLSGGA